MLCCADPVLATDGHTCSTSLTARRQKRAEILGLKTWLQILARNGLCWSQLFCCSLSLSSAAPPPSICPYSLLPTFSNSWSFFNLLLPYSSCPYPPIITPQTSLLLPSISPCISSVLLPDPYGSSSSPSDFSQRFHCSLSLPHVPADRAWRAGHLLNQTSCLLPSPVPPPGIPLMPCHSTPGQRWAQPEDRSGPKPTHTPAPDLLSSPVQPAGAELAPCEASPRETQEHPFQTDRFTLSYETASVPYLQLPAVLALLGGTVTKVGTCSVQVVSTTLKATLISCSFS